MPRGNTSSFFYDDLVLGLDIKGSDFSPQPFRHQVQFYLFFGEMKGIGIKENFQYLLGAVSQRTQQNGRRQFTTPVDTHEQRIFMIEFKIQPGSTVRNHPRGKKQFAGGMRFALVVIEEHTRRAVQLGDDNTLRAIDNKGAVIGHQRQFAHIDFLLLDILDGLVGAFLVINYQPHQRAQRRGIGHTPQLTFLDIKCRFAEPVTHIIQGSRPGITNDWKYR